MPTSPAGHGDVIWHISRRCDGGACVMVARQGGKILIGHMSYSTGPYLTFTEDEWNAFLLGTRRGDFDDLG